MNEEVIKDNFIGGLVTEYPDYALPDGKTPDINNLLPFSIGITKKRPGMNQVDDIERLWGVDYSVLYAEEFETLADGFIIMVGNIDDGIHEIYQDIKQFVGSVEETISTEDNNCLWNEGCLHLNGNYGVNLNSSFLDIGDNVNKYTGDTSDWLDDFYIKYCPIQEIDNDGNGIFNFYQETPLIHKLLKLNKNGILIAELDISSIDGLSCSPSCTDNSGNLYFISNLAVSGAERNIYIHKVKISTFQLEKTINLGTDYIASFMYPYEISGFYFFFIKNSDGFLYYRIYDSDLNIISSAKKIEFPTSGPGEQPYFPGIFKKFGSNWIASHRRVVGHIGEGYGSDGNRTDLLLYDSNFNYLKIFAEGAPWSHINNYPWGWKHFVISNKGTVYATYEDISNPEGRELYIKCFDENGNILYQTESLTDYAYLRGISINQINSSIKISVLVVNLSTNVYENLIFSESLVLEDNIVLSNLTKYLGDYPVEESIEGNSVSCDNSGYLKLLG